MHVCARGLGISFIFFGILLLNKLFVRCEIGWSVNHLEHYTTAIKMVDAEFVRKHKKVLRHVEYLNDSLKYAIIANFIYRDGNTHLYKVTKRKYDDYFKAMIDSGFNYSLKQNSNFDEIRDMADSNDMFVNIFELRDNYLVGVLVMGIAGLGRKTINLFHWANDCPGKFSALLNPDTGMFLTTGCHYNACFMYCFKCGMLFKSYGYDEKSKMLVDEHRTEHMKLCLRNEYLKDDFEEYFDMASKIYGGMEWTGRDKYKQKLSWLAGHGVYRYDRTQPITK